MGRHAAPRPSAPPPGPGQELAAWAVFLVPTSVVVLGLAGAGWGLGLLVGGLGAAAFAAAWVAGRVAAANRREPRHGRRDGGPDAPRTGPDSPPG